MRTYDSLLCLPTAVVSFANHKHEQVMPAEVSISAVGKRKGALCPLSLSLSLSLRLMSLLWYVVGLRESVRRSSARYVDWARG